MCSSVRVMEPQDGSWHALEFAPATHAANAQQQARQTQTLSKAQLIGKSCAPSILNPLLEKQELLLVDLSVGRPGTHFKATRTSSSPCSQHIWRPRSTQSDSFNSQRSSRGANHRASTAAGTPGRWSARLSDAYSFLRASRGTSQALVAVSTCSNVAELKDGWRNCWLAVRATASLRASGSGQRHIVHAKH